LIRDVRPDSVMIELCEKRKERMQRKMAAAGRPTDSSEADVAALIDQHGFSMFKDRIM
jgi:pheromone shutdown protein TraB